MTKGLLYVQAEVNLVNSLGGVSLRNKKGSGKRPGTFNEFVNLFRKRNERLAATFSAQVAANARRSLQRPRASSGRLIRAIEDPRNRVATSTKWGYGVEAWLDQSPARYYWRQIEEGSSVHVGRVLHGAWSAQRGSGPFYPFDRRRNQDVFTPMREDGSGFGVITKPIEPHLFMKRTWDSFDPREKSRQALYETLVEAGIIQKGSVPGQRRGSRARART